MTYESMLHLGKCLLCGSQRVEMSEEYYEWACGYRYRAVCPQCEIYGPEGLTEQEAATLWNDLEKYRTHNNIEA